MMHNIQQAVYIPPARAVMISETGEMPSFLLGEEGWVLGEGSLFLSLKALAVSRLPLVSCVVVELSLVTWLQFDFIARKIKCETPDSSVLFVSAQGEAVVHCVAEYARTIGLRVFGRRGAWLENFSELGSMVLPSYSFRVESGRRYGVPCSLRARLLRALDAGTVIFSYQPKLSLSQGLKTTILGYEQLISSLGDEFRGIALSYILAEFRACGRLGDLVWLGVNQALHDFAVLQTLPGQCCLSINWPVEMTLDPCSSERLIKAVGFFGIPRECICLELSEYDCYMESIQSVRSIVSLSLAGFKISLDDFGIKNSNLLALSFLPVSELKIDRGLTSQVVSWPRAAMVTDMTILLCKSLGIHVVAEGVETAKEVEWFKTAGCDAVQGHFYAPKMELYELEKWASSVQ